MEEVVDGLVAKLQGGLLCRRLEGTKFLLLPGRVLAARRCLDEPESSPGLRCAALCTVLDRRLLGSCRALGAAHANRGGAVNLGYSRTRRPVVAHEECEGEEADEHDEHATAQRGGQLAKLPCTASGKLRLGSQCTASCLKGLGSHVITQFVDAQTFVAHANSWDVEPVPTYPAYLGAPPVRWITRDLLVLVCVRLQNPVFLSVSFNPSVVKPLATSIE